MKTCRLLAVTGLLVLMSGTVPAAGASVPGDVNNDGAFNAQDINLALDAFLKGDSAQLARPDLGDVAPDPSAGIRGYGDGQILSNDLNRLFRALLGLEPLRGVPFIQLNPATVGKDFQVSAGGSLSILAPAGNVSVTLSSSDTSRMLLSKTANTPGSGSIVVSVGAGTSALPTFYIQGLAETGSAQISASASGFDDGVGTTTFTPSGFYIANGDFNTTYASPDTSVTVYAGMLTPGTLTVASSGTLRPGLNVNVPVVSGDTTVGTITTGLVPFNGGDTQASTLFHPVGGGTSQISLTQPSGFSIPASQTAITATVTAPDLTLFVPAVGKDLQGTATGSLAAPAPAGNLSVTITSADPAKLLLSKTVTTPGASSIVVNVDAGSQSIPAFYVQSLADSGTVQLTATAPGFTRATANAVLVPSGFTSNLDGSFDTTSFSIDTILYIYPTRLDPTTLIYTGYQPLRAGINPVSVAVTSETPGVGTITTSPVVLNSGDPYQPTAFHPVSAGSTVLRVVAPAGFITPGSYQTLTANVTAPDITVGNISVGKDLQTSSYASLQAPAPSGGRTVTIQVADSSKALLSDDPNAVGSGSLSLTVPEGQYSTPAFYVQALVGTGSVTYVASTPNYTSKTGTITLVPSGFTSNLDGSFDTTSFSIDTILYIYPTRLDPTTLIYTGYQPLRAGINPVSVAVTSETPGVGTITTSPVVLSGGDPYQPTAFHPVSAGSTVLRVVAPAGFITPGSFQTVTANVSVPTVSLSDVTVGKDLQITSYASLQAPAPAGGRTVTIQVADSSKALLSDDPNAVGSGSLSLTVPEGQYSTPAFYVQALVGTGSVTYVASTPGYTSKTGTITFAPSGFTFPNQSLTTTVSSIDTTLYIYSTRLDPITLNYAGYQNLRGGIGPINVNVTSETPGVGTITTSPVVLSGGDPYQPTAFHPVSAGSAVIRIGTPSGFFASSDYQALTVNVTN